MALTGPRPLRSVLYLPASNPRAIAKSRGLPCDAVILDLEDAVAPDAKADARDAAAAALSRDDFGPKAVIIRVNGLDTPWGAGDLVAASAAQPDAILAPKVSSAADLLHYRSRITDRNIALWAMIETAESVFRLHEIVAAHADAGLTCLVMGTNDLAKETGARLPPGREPMTYALGLTVAAAKSQSLTVLDGVYNALEDDEGLKQECAQGRNFGFDGKTLIHPRQIAACNEAFSPTQAEMSLAVAIVEAFERPENAVRGAIQIRGKMVERLHLTQARRLLAASTFAPPF